MNESEQVNPRRPPLHPAPTPTHPPANSSLASAGSTANNPPLIPITHSITRSQPPLLPKQTHTRASTPPTCQQQLGQCRLQRELHHVPPSGGQCTSVVKGSQHLCAYGCAAGRGGRRCQDGQRVTKSREKKRTIKKEKVTGGESEVGYQAVLAGGGGVLVVVVSAPVLSRAASTCACGCAARGGWVGKEEFMGTGEMCSGIRTCREVWGGVLVVVVSAPVLSRAASTCACECAARGGGGGGKPRGPNTHPQLVM